MLGDVVYQVGSYQEIVELERGSTRVVTCAGGGYSPLYRLEWQDEKGNTQHSPYYTWPEAEANFERRAVE